MVRAPAGPKPSHAAKPRLRANLSPWPIAAIRAVAFSLPMPLGTAAGLQLLKFANRSGGWTSGSQFVHDLERKTDLEYFDRVKLEFRV
jgi:hypothetical protein